MKNLYDILCNKLDFFDKQQFTCIRVGGPKRNISSRKKMFLS